MTSTEYTSEEYLALARNYALAAMGREIGTAARLRVTRLAIKALGLAEDAEIAEKDKRTGGI